MGGGLLLVLFSLSSYGQEGVLDTDFSTDGKLVLGEDQELLGYSAVRTANGAQIYALGHFNMAGGAADPGMIVQLLNDGTFQDSRAFLESALAGHETNFLGGLADPNGRCVAVGEHVTPTGSSFLVARVLQNGLISDASFGIGGSVSTSFGPGDSRAWDVVRQGDGKLVVAGWYHNGTNYDMAVARYTGSGILDQTFSSNGTLTLDLGGDEIAHAVAIQADGKVIVAGTKQLGASSWFFVKRYLTNGSSDLQFGDAGLALTALEGGAGNDAWDVALRSDGRIVLCGVAAPQGLPRPAMACFMPNGSLDPTFGGSNGGFVIDDPPGNEGGFYSIAIEPGDTILCAGYTKAGSEDFVIGRYVPNGQRWPDFGWSGWAVPQIGNGDARARSVEFQSDSRILVCGTTTQNGVKSMGLVRLVSSNMAQVSIDEVDSDGSLDGVFPVPASDQVTIRYHLNAPTRLSIQLTELNGGLVTMAMNETNMASGAHAFTFELPAGLASGAYMVVLASEYGKRSVRIIH